MGSAHPPRGGKLQQFFASGWRSETTGGLLSRSVALHSRGREPDGAETRHRPAARFHRARSQHSPPAGKAGSRTPNVGSMKLARLRPSAGLCAGQSMQSAVGPGQCLCSWLLPVSLWRVEASLANSCTNLVPPRGRVGGRLPAVPGLRSVEAVSAASASGPVEGAGLSAWASRSVKGRRTNFTSRSARRSELTFFLSFLVLTAASGVKRSGSGAFSWLRRRSVLTLIGVTRGPRRLIPRRGSRSSRLLSRPRSRLGHSVVRRYSLVSVLWVRV